MENLEKKTDQKNLKPEENRTVKRKTTNQTTTRSKHINRKTAFIATCGPAHGIPSLCGVPDTDRNKR
jgi:hypothetical protein